MVPYKKLKELDSKVEEEATELTVLTEIRDLWQQGATADSAGKHVSRLAIRGPPTTRTSDQDVRPRNEIGPRHKPGAISLRSGERQFMFHGSP